MSKFRIFKHLQKTSFLLLRTLFGVQNQDTIDKPLKLALDLHHMYIKKALK